MTSSQPRFENLPPRVQREVQRILDAEARRLLAEQRERERLAGVPEHERTLHLEIEIRPAGNVTG